MIVEDKQSEKICPIPVNSEYGHGMQLECIRDKCAWWIPNIDYSKNEMPDNGCCAIKQIARNLSYLERNDYDT